MLTFAYARREIVVIAASGFVVTGATAWWLHAWAVVPGLLTLGLLSFYRDPSRTPPAAPHLLLAPADGRVVGIARDVADDGTADTTLRIMIFLSVANVHVNRSPCAGHVTDVTYRRGAFLNALRSEADQRNESNTVTLAPGAPLPGPVRVRQIAGVFARRIVCAVCPRDALRAGQRIGMIKLGSRTELSVPEDPRWELRVAVGDKVKAGLTILAVLQPAETRGTRDP